MFDSKGLRGEPLNTSMIISAGKTTSDSSIDLGQWTIVGFILSTWDDAAITFQAGISGASGSFYPVYGTTAELSITSPGDKDNGFIVKPDNLAHFAGLRYVKLVAGASQGAAVTITPLVRSVS